ncbi:MAG: hypothetical protein EAZ30_02715 [Betaproteobacteria bacterium]|nr:MAG: hypothetical protein EAZ30_02715 [Betaproteobacteria bacterium]
MVIDYVDQASLTAGETGQVKTPLDVLTEPLLGSESVAVALRQLMRVSRKAACIREHAPHRYVGRREGSTDDTMNVIG